VHDISDLESRGIPGVFIASSEFVEAAEAQGAALGFAPAAHFVAHPIQDRNDDEIRLLADRAYEEILAQIVANGGM